MIAMEKLCQIKLFTGLKPDILKILQSMLVEQRYEKGAYIIEEDTFGDQMYLLCEGTVIVTKELVKGIDCGASKEKVLATLRSKIFPTFGENGLLGHGARTANVIAQTDCIIYTLTNHEYSSFARNHIEAAYQIMTNIAKILSDRLHDTDNNLVKLATAFYIAVQR